MKPLKSCFIFLALLLVAAPVFADGPRGHLPAGLVPADEPAIPPSFQGIWTYTEIYRDCTTQQILDTFTGTDTVCAEDNTAPPDTTGLGNFSCSGSSTATTYDVSCTGSQEIVPGCTQNFGITIASSVSGNTVTSITTINVTYAGCGVPFPPSCTRYEYTGTRIGTATEECATPVQPTTWSGIKANYR